MSMYYDGKPIGPRQFHVMDDAIAADLRALKLLWEAERNGTRFRRMTPGVRVGGVNIPAALADAEHETHRQREIIRAREYRRRKREGLV